ncbi:phage tail sheath family protein [Gelidibacter maritimus]|uniref:Phage tail sheath family protein n=1 Tax=Gelidibacter maritimus TaxID=2761487 RepID=A0A7W2R2P7_9FLAO|nr:phage tail sheath subtilisin-like domain-containing protein [Gelidibacter maritimus]MBA6152009.1 phage tail sheath family protein [Gelidibacter maritimus]
MPKVSKDNKGSNAHKNRSTPGVYVQEVSSAIPSITQVETSIPAFIGYTEKGSNSPTRIRSMQEYISKFGGANPADLGVFQITNDGSIIPPELLTTPKYKMYYMLELFFANGGDDCFITSVGHYDNLIQNEDFMSGLALLENEDIPTLILFPDISSSENIGDPAEVYKTALAQCAERKDRFLICDVKESNSDISDSVEKFRFSMGTENLKYGAAYFPSLQTTLNYHISEDKIQVKLNQNNKTMVLKHPEDLIARDPSKAETSLYHADNGNYRTQYQQIKQRINTIHLKLPPSAAVAGVYAKADASRGVWKAPANISLNKVTAPTLAIDNNAQANLNVDSSGKSINAIRSFKGKGVMVWGARTLASNDYEWRYIPVMRMGMTIETSVKNALAQFKNAPNNPATWSNVKAMITNYLIELWRAGALMGAKPEQAYFVRVGLNETMTEHDVNNGKMIVDIGISPSRPAEFSLLRISQDMHDN